MAQLQRLFEVRHILCHEAPRRNIYNREEVEPWLSAAANLAEVIDDRLTYLLHGTVPVATHEIVHSLANESRALRIQLDEVLERIQADELRRKLINESQAAWESFKNKQCELRADNARGGTISRVLWAQEERELLSSRLEMMKWYVEREEGVM